MQHDDGPGLGREAPKAAIELVAVDDDRGAVLGARSVEWVQLHFEAMAA